MEEKAFVIVYQMANQKEPQSKIIKARDMDIALDILTRKKEFELGYQILLVARIP